jgi:putative endonuclease
MNHKGQVGSFGQKLAVDFLRQRKYQIEAENFRTRQGEIDIIALRDGQVIFVEVKTRLSDRFGLPEEAVSASKLEKMRLTAYKYLKENGVNHDNFRFDIVAIVIDKADKKANIRHYKNIE